MQLVDWLTIAAIIAAPLVAIRVSVFLDDRKMRWDRQITIYRTLMATRATVLSHEHVRALNSIDIEFQGAKFTRVREAWRALLDALERRDPQDQDVPQWTRRAQDLRLDLLYQMGQSLGYSIDRVHINRAAYHPIGHGEVEDELHRIRRSLLAVLEGGSAIPVQFTPSDQEVVRMDAEREEQQALRRLLIEVLSGRSALRVADEARAGGVPPAQQEAVARDHSGHQ